MQNLSLLSIWLVPQQEDEKCLSKIINKLGKENNAPLFAPHLTLFGDVTIELSKLKEAVDKVFDNVKPFKIKRTGISQSELFFKTVFVEFEKSNLIINLFENLARENDEERDLETFKPHISLIYKSMPESEKIKIIENLTLKDEFTIDRVIINAPAAGAKDFYKVGGWQSLYTKQLE